MVPAGGLASVASAPVKASCGLLLAGEDLDVDAARARARPRRARRGCSRRGSPRCPRRCTSLTPCSRATRACAATIAASSATASAGIAPPSSGTRRRKRRTATTSRRRPPSRSATSSRVVLVPMSTHAQLIWLPSSPQVSTSAPAILVRDLRKAYGELEAVRGIDFEVAPGEVFGLLGPNGAGKTTTVEILEGYRGPHGGIVSVLGHDPRQRSRGAARAGRHRPAVERHVPPRQGARGGAPLGPLLPAPARRRRGHRDRRPAGEGATRYVRTLSGGQPRRLDLALALVGDPELDLPRRADDGLRPRGAPQRVGGRSARCRSSARRSCSPRTTSTRRRRCATASRSSRTGGSSPRARRASSGTAATRYRVAWRDEQRRAADARGERPDRAAAPAHERARWPAAQPLRDLSVTRPSLEDVYLELTAEAPGGGRTMAEAAALAWRHYRLERRMFWRNPTAAFFSFVLPLIFLFLFGAIFSGDQKKLEHHRPGHRRHERHGDDVQRPRHEHDLPARGGRAQAHPRHAAAAGLLPRRRGRQRRHQRRRAGRDRRPRRAALLRPRLAEGLARARRLLRRRRRLPRLARRRLLARHPELRRRPGLHEHRLPAGHLHLRRLLRRRQRAAVPARHRAGPPAHPHHQRALGGARHRRVPGRQPAGTWPSSWRGASSARSSRCAGSAGSRSGIRR